LGEGRFRLSRLLRGRAGTEWAIDRHSIGEPFAMIEADALRAVSLPSSAAGASVTASVRNLSGTTSTTARQVTESLRPLSPVALHAVDASGDLALTWTRRSRKGFAWVDEMDAQLGESMELYRVTILGSQGIVELQATESALQVTAAEIERAGPGPAMVEVRQIGDAAVSRPAQISVTI
jgi:hypothetical protein